MLAVSPYVSVVIFLVIMFVLATLYSRTMIKGQNKEAAHNAQVAQQAGMRYIHRPTEQPTGVFDVMKQPSRIASHFAIDPKTNDWSLQLYYHVPPPVIHLKGDHGEDYNLSFASVMTGFWIEYNIVIFPKPRIGRFKGRYLTGNEEFDKKWVVGSMRPEAIPSVVTPAVMNALMHPPFEFKKDTKITFRGPLMGIETQLVDFAKRIELLRWCQNLVKLADTRNAPHYGQFTIEPQHTSGNELPWTAFTWPDDDQPELGPDIGREQIVETDDAETT